MANVGDSFTMNTAGLENWYPRQPAEIIRKVEVVERYAWDQYTRFKVRILDGPEKGRVVSGIGESQLRPVGGA